MKTKIILFIVFLFTLKHCGFNPIYSNIKETEFRFNIVEIGGNEEMNRITETSLKRYSNNLSDKIYDLKIITNFEKNTISKNKKGEITSYLILTEIEFEILNSDKNIKFNYTEETRTTNIANQFEFKKYENSIKSNFIKSKIDEFVLKLTSSQ